MYLLDMFYKYIVLSSINQVKSVKTGSVFWAACTSLSYFYMVSMYMYDINSLNCLIKM